ncbi:mesaconyl-C(4)-CoA hydratase (plasmid) [Antarctobacter heliothermus]|uniref:Mesaconyl-C(4)-CoA hydratase n=1 Tax=Antarctobacter heliothermus TaxID=74033 RepID=A0A222EBF0_9RHOB|nr:MaoC family dehydratase N-terminal domain-containing protein [Antarctobacter heliothermus]ASP23524.1 mesaconyl-C(4)-CoA hydratase [Antarctobacter heliothermus]
MQIDLEHLQEWIGREEHTGETLTPALIARFNATFDRISATEEGSDAPALVHFCLGQPNVPTAELGHDGHPARGGFLPPVPLPRRMWAGGAVEFHTAIRIGDHVTRRSVIEDVRVKRGQSGTLCFVTVRHHVESGGRAALTERQDIVYRDAPATSDASPVKTPERAPFGKYRAQVLASAPLLFRYSALTFNAHRIHYDLPYVQGEEHYPGLVIHGPLQATMLCQYAAELRGSTPTSFRFRSRSPIFGPDVFTLNAAHDGDALNLWTAQSDGSVSMEATAEW